MNIKYFNNPELNQNSYLLVKKYIGIVIDPGFNGQKIIDYVKEKNITISYVILTHGHFDHIRDIQLLAQNYTFEVYISEFDRMLLFNDGFNYARLFGSNFIMPDYKINYLHNKDLINILSETFEIIATPGHTKGSICIKYNDVLFSGDLLFYSSIGRTDLYSGNRKEIFNSVKLISNTISNNTMIYPGHEKFAKLAEIKKNNPYIK